MDLPAVPDRELDSFVDALARRLASFDAQALAIAKRSVHRHAPASLDEYRELAGLRTLISSPATAAQRTALATHAPAVGQDFELRMGHHLGLVSPNT
jgi:enoyl-CoA hydratase/carnithine racemase